VIDTITRLTTAGYLEHEQAADLLAASPYALRPELSPQASRLAEVAEAVAHDLAEGRMKISDDDLFSAALEDVSALVLPCKDEAAARPIPTAWRASLCEIIRAFVEGDYMLERGIRSVAPPSARVASQVRTSLAGYGEHLVDLPAETWRTSVCQWMRGHWEIVVDLWTAESGPSDLVLQARVFEAVDGYRIEVTSVSVP